MKTMVLRSEWESVYQELYSGHCYLQKHALDRITVWKCRFLHKLPTAVMCTSDLVSAQLSDVNGEHTKDQSELNIRLNYAMALIRFINLLTEKQQNRQYAQPVHILAEELGIPEWIVDLRHEATHNNLPSLNMLKAGVQFVLSWLQREYWEASCDKSIVTDSEGDQQQLSHDDDNEMNPDAAQSSDILLTYMNEKFRTLNDKQNKQEIQQILKDLDKMTVLSRKQIIAALVQPGYLIPTPEQLEALDIDVTSLMSEEDVKLPATLVKFWQPLLRHLHHLNLTSDLIQTLLEAPTGDGLVWDRLVIGWIFTIIDSINFTQEKARQSEFISLYRHSCDLEYTQILKSCLLHPTKLTGKLLPSIIPHVKPGLSDTQHAQLVHLVDIYTGSQTESTNIPDEEQLHNLTSIVQMMRTGCSESQNGEIGNNSIQIATTPCTKQHCDCKWKLASDKIEWSGVPFGVHPSSTITYTNMELPPSVNNLRNGETTNNRPSLNNGEMASEDLHSSSENAQSQESFYIQTGTWTTSQLQSIIQKVSIF